MIKRQFNTKAKPQKWRPEMTDRFLDEVEAGHVTYVARMLSKHPSLAYATRIEVVRLNDYDEDYVEKSALHIAATHDRGKIVALLLDAGARINDADGTGETPLMDAATNNSADAMRELLRGSASHSQRNDKGLQALHRAARNNSLDCAKLLLRAGARINTATKQGRTPLHEAVYGAIELEGHADERKMLRLLLEKGANIDATCNDGFTPANEARSEGKRDLANFIEDYALQVVEMNEMEDSAREQKALNVLRQGSIKPITARKPIQFRK
jgi:serine/threonine-protein phosphatase 6 regulatory ankyrin repeat subunit A